MKIAGVGTDLRDYR